MHFMCAYKCIFKINLHIGYAPCACHHKQHAAQVKPGRSYKRGWVIQGMEMTANEIMAVMGLSKASSNKIIKRLGIEPVSGGGKGAKRVFDSAEFIELYYKDKLGDSNEDMRTRNQNLQNKKLELHLMKETNRAISVDEVCNVLGGISVLAVKGFKGVVYNLDLDQEQRLKVAKEIDHAFRAFTNKIEEYCESIENGVISI